MDADVAAFLERFRAFGAAPGVATYLALFHSEATLFDSGMERPLGVPEIPAHIEGILKLVPDFRMVPERWRARGATLFVEARNAGTLGPAPASWPSVYGMDLRGDRVLRGRRYYDRRPLFARLGAALPALPGFAAVAHGPGDEPGDEVLESTPVAASPEGFVEAMAAGRARRRPWPALARALPELSASVAQWAGDDELVFVEWEARGKISGAPFLLGVVERFDRRGDGVRVRACFDSLALATRLAAATAG
jgi:hypothetical protein